MAMGFRSNIFDPLLVGSQILALQCCFYVTMGLWLVLADMIAGIQLSVDQLFDYKEFEGPHDGWLVMGAVALNAFSTALAMWWIVRRAKLCLDFSITVYLLHLLLSVLYGGLPHSWAWWITNTASLVITVVVGEFLCMRSELAAIPVTGEAKT
ncbi:protein SYS1 homolog [Halichondria panicea]|uniref:protein SYS1 homolog n=1 Tax=Halichondria panicea TaxID=6063 RepID=UPI00312B64BB